MLLWSGLAFVCAQLGFGLLLDSCWQRLRFPQAAAILAEARQLAVQPDLVCLGSSRLGVAFRPFELSEQLRRQSGRDDVVAFNACIEAGDTLTSEFMLNQLLAEGVRPRLVIVEVSPETLAERNAWMHLHVDRQLRWQDLPDVWLDVWRSRNGPRLLATRLLPLHAYRREIKATLVRYVPAVRLSSKKRGNSVDTEPTPLPFVDTLRIAGRTDRSLPPWEKRQIWLQLVRNWLRDYRLGGSAGRALDRLVARCQQEGIEVVLLGAPVAASHRDLYTPAVEGQFQACMARLTALPGCTFVDWRAEFEDEFFVDNHHLFREGALEFTTRLARWFGSDMFAQASAKRAPRP